MARKTEDLDKNDHRVIGKQLELFTLIEKVGTGLPLWLPHGATIRRILERFIVDLELEHGYQHVYTPVMARTELYKQAGHLAHFKEDMFPPMKVHTEKLTLRPMNCPHHIMIYKMKKRSYRELPMKLAELGTMFRYEKSGALYGLARVRQMTLNDAHIFCEENQIEDEIKNIIAFVKKAYSALGLEKDIWFRLSLRDPKDKKKYVKGIRMWNKAEKLLKKVLKGSKFVEAKGEAAYYGPKIDVQMKNLMGHEETLATIQLDFYLPEKFDLKYTGKDNQVHRAVMIHRGGISTMERIVAFLTEKYQGNFPLWLAPIQVMILTLSEKNIKHAKTVEKKLRDAGFRVDTDYSNSTVEYKVRDASLMKIPYIINIGEKEEKNNTLAVRTRDRKVKFAVKITDFIKDLQKEIEEKK